VYPYNAGSTVLEPEYIDERFRIFVSWSEPHPEMIGKDLNDIAIEWGINQKEAAERLKPGGGVYFSMKEEDVRRILSDPNSMIGSDGLPRDVNPHPRLWGTFQRELGHYSRDEGLLDLETAIYKMTGLTATNFRLKIVVSFGRERLLT
jgi:N-acyl-D-amino-acid deacylase